MLSVAEMFISINGEGTHAGELAFFIRFKGCNLCCTYCDTCWANLPDTPAVPYSAEELTQKVQASGIRNVTLTGGEPLLQDNLPLLTDSLISLGYRVEIETNGSLSLSALAQRSARPVFTMDYKLPDSGMESFMCTDNFRLLGSHDTVKFVAGSLSDLEKAAQIIRQYHLTEKCHVYLSPVFGRIDPADMVEFMKERQLNDVRLQLQLHKFIWDPQKRAV